MDYETKRPGRAQQPSSEMDALAMGVNAIFERGGRPTGPVRFDTEFAEQRMERSWWVTLRWVALLALLGFAGFAVLTGEPSRPPAEALRHGD